MKSEGQRLAGETGKSGTAGKSGAAWGTGEGGGLKITNCKSVSRKVTEAKLSLSKTEQVLKVLQKCNRRETAGWGSF